MAYFDEETATALGALDQLAASDNRSVGTAQLRKLVMQANLLRTYPTVATSCSWHLPGASENTAAEMRLDLLPQQKHGLMVWGAPIWPAHDALEARIRVRTDSGVVSRLGVQVDDAPITWVSYTGTGALQTVTLPNVPVPVIDTRLDRRLRLYAEGGVPTAAASSTGGTNPFTIAAGGTALQPLFITQGAATWADTLISDHFVLAETSGGQMLWARPIASVRAPDSSWYALTWTEPLSTEELEAGRQSGVTFAVVRAQSITLGGIAMRGFTA